MCVCVCVCIGYQVEVDMYDHAQQSEEVDWGGVFTDVVHKKMY